MVNGRQISQVQQPGLSRRNSNLALVVNEYRIKYMCDCLTNPRWWPMLLATRPTGAMHVVSRRRVKLNGKHGFRGGDYVSWLTRLICFPYRGKSL